MGRIAPVRRSILKTSTNMLLVVLGHIMTGCTVGAEESFLFNIVWSLQMPMFILISGYVTKYRLDVDGVVKKIMGTDYVKEELEGRPHAVEA